MTVVNPELVICGTDADYLKLLQRASATLPYVSYEFGYGPRVTANASLDALWATPLAALELFGVEPPFPVHEARIVKTPPGRLPGGLPRYGVIGVATSKDDPKDPEFNLRLVVSRLLKAVNTFNSHGGDTIRRVGILPEDLDLRRLDPAAAFRIVREIYEQGQLSAG